MNSLRTKVRAIKRYLLKVDFVNHATAFEFPGGESLHVALHPLEHSSFTTGKCGESNSRTPSSKLSISPSLQMLTSYLEHANHNIILEDIID